MRRRVSAAVAMLLAPVIGWLFMVGPLTSVGAFGEDDVGVQDAGEVLNLVVNSTDDGADDYPGNGTCETAPGNGVCTLKAAIMEGNATADTDVIVKVTTEVGGRITLPADWGSMMKGYQVTARDHGAYLSVERTMSIDLGGVLGLGAESSEPDEPDESDYGALWVAGLYVNAPNVVLENISNFFATDSSIVFGPNSDGSSLTGGTNIQTENSHGNRFVVVTNGADNITISDLKIGRLANDSDDSSLNVQNGGIVIGLPPPPDNPPVKDLTIHKVTVDNTPAEASACNFLDGGGCASNGIIAAGLNQGENWTISDCTLQSFPAGTFALNLSGVVSLASGWSITGNHFYEVRSGPEPAKAALSLPTSMDVGSITVENNKFLNTASDVGYQGTAIYWGRNIFLDYLDPASRVVIQNNKFEGYKADGSATIYLNRKAQSVTVRYNWFGPNTNASTSTAESTDTGNVILANDNQANGKPRVFKPQNSQWANGKLEVEFVIPDADDNVPQFAGGTVAIDVYAVSDEYTAKYLSITEEIEKPTPRSDGPYTISVTFDAPPMDVGKLRFQMHSVRPNQGGTQSSQFSDVITLTTRPNPSVAVELRAWRDVPEGITEYEEIVALDPATYELPDASTLPVNLPVWFTYTVTNIGNVGLNGVIVKDSEDQQVCTIQSLPPDPSVKKGCAGESTSLTPNNTS